MAPIATTVRGLSTEVPVGVASGLDQSSVVGCDNIVTVPAASLGRHLGHLHVAQEPALADAIRAAFDLA